MHNYPIENCLNFNFVQEKFDKTHIKNVLNQIKSKNLIIYLISETYDSDYELDESSSDKESDDDEKYKKIKIRKIKN